MHTIFIHFVAREDASNQTTAAADNNCILMPCTSETESEGKFKSIIIIVMIERKESVKHHAQLCKLNHCRQLKR